MTENIARYGKKAGIKGLIFASSISLHGDIRVDIVDETTDRINPTPYGLSKHLCELVLQDYQALFPVIALRLCGVLGHGAKNAWLSRVLEKARQGEAIGIVNADRAFNNIVHKDDLLVFLLQLMAHGFSGFHAFPIASHDSLSVKSVVAEIIAATHSSSEIVDCGITDNSFTISNEYAMKEFRYEPSDVTANLKKYVQA
jgi:UDP-glucose 4-epimerase